MGELNVYRQLGIKPNFTQIGKKYGLHRQTVAKYWRRGEEIEDRRRDKESAFDEFRDVIESKAMMPGVTKKAIHEFLLDRHPDAALPKYGAFTKYCRERGIECPPAAAPEPHPRFETPPGRQLQFDWKEGLRMVDANGEVFEFNVFSAVLGFSRSHRFVYSRTRTEDDLLACLLSTFVRFGGVPDEAITDNMAGFLMAQGKVDLVILGCDRMAANGDFANKIGTYSVAVNARYHGIPFYTALPSSTIDLSIEDGSGIPIEERPGVEVTHLAGVQTAPEQVRTWNPAFDVTPHQLLTGIITERGVIYPPFRENLAKLFG